MNLCEISMTIFIDLGNVHLYPKMRRKKIHKKMTAILVYSLENKRFKKEQTGFVDSLLFLK